MCSGTTSKMKSIWDSTDDDVDNDISGILSSSGDFKDVIIHYSQLDKVDQPIWSYEEMNLHPSILEALYRMKVFKPCRVQCSLLPLLADNKEKHDVVVHTKKSGKTISGLIFLLNSLSLSQKKSSQALIVCPTLELVNKTLEKAQKFADCNKLISCQSVERKNKFSKQIEQRVIVGTPEKMVDIINKKVIDMKNVEILLFDDVQFMLKNKGHEQAMFRIVQSCCPTASQFIFLSSAASAEQTNKFLANALICKNFCPISIEFPVTQHCSPKVKQYFIACEDSHKKELLKTIIYLRSFGQMVIICETKNAITNVCSYLIQDVKISGALISPLYGKMTKTQRETIVTDFKDGNKQILVTTQNFTNINTPALITIINYDHFINADLFELNMEHYDKWLNVVTPCKESIVINFVEQRGATYVFEKAMNKRNFTIIDKEKLTTKLLRMNKSFQY